MPEFETPPENQWTTIKIVIPLRYGRERKEQVKVPFTSAEIILIQAAHDAQESKAVRSKVVRGSGPIRELGLRNHVPWGYSLQDRKRAIEEMRETLNAATSIVEKPPSYASEETIAEIGKIKDSLNQFLSVD